MVKKRIITLLMACVILCVGLAVPANAVDRNNAVSIHELTREPAEVSSLLDDEGGFGERAFGTVRVDVPAGTIAKAKSQSFSLETGETVRINCSYSPESASVDFGLIAPDGYFYYERVTGGDINKAIQVDERGTYILAVRNNSSDTVSVVGFVHY